MSIAVRLLSLLFLFALSIAVARAQDVPPLVGYVNDTASLLSNAARERLDAQLAQFHATEGPQLVVLTVTDLQGLSVEELALKIATTWQLGDAKRDDGMLLLLAKRERRVRIEVGYGLEGQIPDATAARIIRSLMTPALKRGDYDGAVQSACNALIAHAATPSVPEAQALHKSARSTTRTESLSFGAVLRWFFAIFFLLSFLAGAFRKRSSRASTGVSFSSSFSSREPSSVVSSASGGSDGISGGGGGFGGGGASGSW